VPAVVPPTTSAVASTPTHQVVVSQEPEEPNVYKFRFAATMDEPHTALVQNVGPEAVDPAVNVPEALPADLTGAACGCNQGGMGAYGCPYLPGQSGTRSLCGVDCGRCGAPCSSTWSDAQCIPWSLFGPGEYVGPARPAHVDTYYLRVNDFITLTFIESRKKSSEHYRIGVGDRLQIEWLQGAGNAELPLNRELLVQPDGTVTLPLIGEVNASGKTINDFRDEVVKLYSKYQRDPQITVTPISVNVAVQYLLKAVTAKNQSSGQTQDLRVAPDGTIQAAGIGNVYVQGLTLDELRSEIEARYVQAYGPGITVSPQLTDRAVSYVFLGGEVKAPGRYTLEGPTTVMQAIAMAGGWNIGGNVRQVVVFRRDENWCLKATKIDVRAPLYGNDPCPMNDVWLRENDLVLVPKTKILCATDMINLYFTRGVYAVFPISYVYDFSQNSGIVPVP
jgi:polysaccharide export outer membrane protein